MAHIMLFISRAPSMRGPASAVGLIPRGARQAVTNWEWFAEAIETHTMITLLNADAGVSVWSFGSGSHLVTGTRQHLLARRLVSSDDVGACRI